MIKCVNFKAIMLTLKLKCFNVLTLKPKCQLQRQYIHYVKLTLKIKIFQCVNFKVKMTTSTSIYSFENKDNSMC